MIGGCLVPLDATNIPFSRHASNRDNSLSEPEGSVSDKLDTTLRIENLLLEEFNYASVTAYQSMEDRARISSFYYLLLGVLTSGLAAIYQFGGSLHNYAQPLVITLLVVASIVSTTFFVIIIRLRQAYRESVICMNVIKEFYIQQFQQQMPGVEHAFRWRLKTIPTGERIGSVTFIMGYLIALMGSLCIAGAVFFGAYQFFSGFIAFIMALVTFAVILGLHIFYYRHSLSKRSEAAIIQAQEKQMGILPEANPPLEQ
jgi:hypothetical protein